MKTKRIERVIETMEIMKISGVNIVDMLNWDTCLVSYLVKVPYFQKMGLEFDIEPVYENYYGYEALMKFFDLDENQIKYLFYIEAHSLSNLKIHIDHLLNQWKKFLRNN